jgi:drug/metabolite transporter (DMT)-like permease
VCAAQVPFLAGSKLGDQRQIKPVIWLSAFGALGGVSLLENGGGSPPGMGDLWSLLSAIFFGVQVSALRNAVPLLPPAAAAAAAAAWCFKLCRWLHEPCNSECMSLVSTCVLLHHA